ncbi:MAG TPA: enoyl-CoA hydratase/isomerase family protein [Blastocatellia bacterium]|nr:enoyl-CoA hydratase/isomerase family protein [Blastocatellia bacterium]
MTTKRIHLETHAGMAVLRIDRPPANAIDLELARELESAFAAVEAGDAIRALVLTGAGSCLSAGLDLKVVPTYPPDRQREMVMALNGMVGRLYGLQLPTVAAVNGHAIAGGLILTLACDYRVGAEGDYKLGLSEARVGFPFPVAPMEIVRAELAPPVARIATLLARNIGPQEALANRMLDELQPPDRLLPRALEIAQEMAELPRSTYGRIKRRLRADALARIEDATVNGNDPMLNSWLGAETSSAAAEVLRGRS